MSLLGLTNNEEGIKCVESFVAKSKEMEISAITSEQENEAKKDLDVSVFFEDLDEDYEVDFVNPSKTYEEDEEDEIDEEAEYERWEREREY